MSSTVALKINIVALNITKTLQFFTDKSIGEVLKEVYERINGQAGGPDHGLFWPTTSKWLANNKTLDYYDIKSGDLLEYRKKHRALKVRMMDETVKTILIDESLTVATLVDAVSRKIGISNPEEYSFCLEETAGAAGGAGADAGGTMKGRPVDKNGTVRGGKGADNRGGTVRGAKPGPGEDLEETKWLNPDKCLAEQGVTDNDVIMLKKKFFFSDQNIDRNDPIQLNLLYVQSRDAIINGQHPCTAEEATQFAAIQCQAQFGNNEPDKHKPGFVNPKEFLPLEYRKRKDVEKKIFQEHRKLQGMTELNAKFRYVQLCRSLKTYGVTFFSVRERVPKKKKMIPMLLGVTRESVMRVDPESKEVIKSWPLTTLRRWAATPNNFTLDFGDYSDSYYGVETNEGDKISQLIAGYIDIILKRKRDADRDIDQAAFEEMPISEDVISGVEASNISYVQGKLGRAQEVNVAQAGVLSDGSHMSSYSTANPRHQLQFMSIGKGGMGARVNKQLATMTAALHNPLEAQSALVQNIQNGLASLGAVAVSLNDTVVINSFGPGSSDGESAASAASSELWRNQTLQASSAAVFAQLTSHVSAACSIINQTSVDPSKVNYNAFAASVSTLTNNLSQLVPNVKTLASLQSDPVRSDELMSQAKSLASSTAKFLTAAQPCISGVGSRQELLTAGNAIGEACSSLIMSMNMGEIPVQVQRELEELSRGISLSVSNLIGITKRLAQKASDAKSQAEIQNLSKLLTQTASQLVTCTSMIAPVAMNASCQNQIEEAIVLLKDCLMGLEKRSMNSSDSVALMELGPASQKVQEGMSQLLTFLSRVDKPAIYYGNANVVSAGGEKSATAIADNAAANATLEFEEKYDKLVKECQMLVSEMADPAKVIAHTKTIVTITSELTNLMKARAVDAGEGDERNRLTVAHRKLNESILPFVTESKEYCKALSTGDNSEERREALLASIGAFEGSVGNSVGFIMRGKIFHGLVTAAKAAAISTSQLVTATKAVGPSNRNQASQLQLSSLSKKTNDLLGGLAGSIRDFSLDTDNPGRQVKLLTTAAGIVGPAQSLVSACRTAAPFVNEFASQAQLTSAFAQCSDDLIALAHACQMAQHISGDLELESALENAKSIKAHLVDLHQRFTASANPDLFWSEVIGEDGSNMDAILFGDAHFESANQAGGDIQSACSNLSLAVNQLLSAAAQRNNQYVNVAARDTSYSIDTVADGLVYLAAMGEDGASSRKKLEVAIGVTDSVLEALSQAKGAMENQSADKQQTRTILSQHATLVQESISNALDHLPVFKELEKVQVKLTDLFERVNKTKLPPPIPGDSYAAAQVRLNTAAVSFNTSLNEMLKTIKTSGSAGAGVGESESAIAVASKAIYDRYSELVKESQALLVHTQDEETRVQVMSNLQAVTNASIKMLQGFKSISMDASGAASNSSSLVSTTTHSTTTTATISAVPNNQRNLLASYSRAVGDSIYKFLQVCTSNSAGHGECNQALKIVNNAAATYLEDVNKPPSAGVAKDYFHSYEMANEGLKTLAAKLSQELDAISSSSTSNGPEMATNAAKVVLSAASDFSSLLGHVQNSLFLLAAADPESVPAVPGLIDLEVLLQEARVIEESSEAMARPDANNSFGDIRALAGHIAPATSNICNLAKAASQKTNNPVAQGQLASHAKNIASATSALVTQIKAISTTGMPAFKNNIANNTCPALIAAVKAFVSFAVSPEFGPSAAVISPTTLAVQKPLVAKAESSVQSFRDLIEGVKQYCTSVVESPNYVNTSRQLLQAQCSGLEGNLKQLLEQIKTNAPGQKQAVDTLEKIGLASSNLDNALIQSQMGTLFPSVSHVSNENNVNEEFVSLLKALNSIVEVVSESAVTDASKLGPAFISLQENYLRLVPSSIAYSSTADRALQMDILRGAKELSGNILIFTNTAKRIGGNSSEAENVQINAVKTNTVAAIKKLLTLVEGSNVYVEAFNSASESIQIANNLLESSSATTTASNNAPAPDMGAISKTNKAIIDLVGQIVSSSASSGKAGIPPEDASNYAASLAQNINAIVQLGSKLGGGSNTVEIKDVVRDIGNASLRLVDALKGTTLASIQYGNGGDFSVKQKLSSSALELSTNLTQLSKLLKQSQKGLLQVEEAGQIVSDLLGDLEATLIFAQAGQLDEGLLSESSNNGNGNGSRQQLNHESFNKYKEAMLNEAKGLLDATKTVIVASSGSPSINLDRLGESALNSANLMKSLKENAKRAAVSLTSNDRVHQENLLIVCQGSAETLKSLLAISLNVANNANNNNSSNNGEELKEKAKLMVSKLSELIRVIKEIGDETSRFTRTLENAIEQVETGILSELLDPNIPAKGTASPEEVAALAKDIARGIASIVSQFNSNSPGKQANMVQQVQSVRHLMQDLGRAGKALSHTITASSDGSNGDAAGFSSLLLQAVANTGASLNQLFNVLKQETNNPGNPTAIQGAAKGVAGAVNGVVEATGKLLSTGAGYVDPNDPNVIAERELLAAAASIEAAAKKLAALKPPPKQPGTDPAKAANNLNFEEQILEAAKAIANATSALIKSATNAQREIVANGNIAAAGGAHGEMYFSDGTWSEGLVSAAKQVADSTADLCESANGAVKGTIQPERVIASARGVSASTAQLLSAASVKTDPSSQALIRLRAAGKAVTSATESLVKAAAANSEAEDDENAPSLPAGNGGGLASSKIAEMEAHMQMLALESQLSKARERLAGIRKGRYQS